MAANGSAPGSPHARKRGAGLSVGFIVTSAYQLFHYGAIRRHLTCPVSVYVDVRDADFAISNELVARLIPDASITWLRSVDLRRIDGECSVLVCQTPVPLRHVFMRSKLVAQQYSLAKERYQYGPWRALADLNLMYGEYSAERVAPYSVATAVGNPLLDGRSPVSTPPAPVDPDRLRVLYMPTYGDLSDRGAVVASLVAHNADVRIKAHHADFEIRDIAVQHGLPVYSADHDPIALIDDADVVVSDYSGAIYDALARRTPTLVTDVINGASTDLKRLSTEDLSHGGTVGLTAVWDLTSPLGEAYEESRRGLADDAAYQDYLDRFYVNVGSAGAACARAIEALHEHDPTLSFAIEQVRSMQREHQDKTRGLRAELRQASRSQRSRRLRERAQALQTMLREDPPRVVVKKSTRFAVHSMPGGDRALERLRQWRRGARGDATEDLGSSELASSLPEIPRERRAEIGNLVSAALKTAGVDHRSAAGDSWEYIAVRVDDVAQLRQTLKRLGADHPEVSFWSVVGAKYSRARPIADLALKELLRAESVVVGVPLEVGDYVVGAEGGVEILTVEPRDVRLVARRGRADKIDWTADFATDTVREVLDGPPAPLSSHRSEPTVDVVYTWVDSSDPEWMRDRATWSGEAETVMESAANDERYLDRDELRYSLRSIWAYAPFVRNIYIVTSGHRPSWLVEDNERIKVVSHAEIFPDVSVLPTFNSHAIEAALHRIPGLSESFVYFNDDVFLGREVRFGDFYTKAGLIKSQLSPSAFTASSQPGPDAIPTDWASFNAVSLMREEFGLEFDRKLKHVPHAMTRSLLEDLEQAHPQVFEQTRASRFRSHSDYAIPSMLAHYYGIATRRAVEWPGLPREYIYADSGRNDFQARLDQIVATKPAFFCLNVTLHDDIDFNRQALMLQEFLQRRFPVPSPFEH